MADTRKGQSNATPSQRDQQQQQQQSVKDLDVRKDDVERVKGGARNRASSDPCEGGE